MQVSAEGAALVETQTNALFGDVKALTRQMQEAVGNVSSLEEVMQKVQVRTPPLLRHPSFSPALLLRLEFRLQMRDWSIGNCMRRRSVVSVKNECQQEQVAQMNHKPCPDSHFLARMTTYRGFHCGALQLHVIVAYACTALRT